MRLVFQMVSLDDVHVIIGLAALGLDRPLPLTGLRCVSQSSTCIFPRSGVLNFANPVLSMPSLC